MRGKAFAGQPVREALRELRAAKSKFRRTIKAAQDQCPHLEVFEQAYKTSEFFSTQPAMRVCRVCGYYEFGRYGSYSDGTGWTATGREALTFEETKGYKTRLGTQFAVKVAAGAAAHYMVRLA